MQRNDPEDVKNILETDLTDSQVEAFIVTAAVVVDNNIPSTASLSDDELCQIELYLAAHFCCLRDPRQQSRGMGRANDTLQGQTAMRLESSLYGQTAMLIDRSGTLAKMNARKYQASMSFIGSDVSEVLTPDSYTADAEGNPW